MRRLCVWLSALLGVLALAGCAAFTDPATRVSTTSAQLNGHGHTDSSPAHYYFQYATALNALGTGFGLQTPTSGPVPANFPGNGTDVSFSKTVTGLAPGTTYYFRVCGGDQKVSPDVCSNVQSLFTDPSSAQNYMTGSYGFQNTRSGAAVQAASGPSGRGPEGNLFYFNTGASGVGFAFQGQVTCLIVRNNQAAVGAVGRASDHDYPPFQDRPYTELVSFVGDPSTGTVTIGREQFTTGSTPPDCSTASFAGQRTSRAASSSIRHPKSGDRWLRLQRCGAWSGGLRGRRSPAVRY